MAKYTPSPDCYAAANAASGEKLSKEDIEAAFQRVVDYRDKLKASGDITGMEQKLRSFAEREAERTRIAAALQRRQAALNILVRDRLDQTLDGFTKAGLKPNEAILALMEGTQRGVEGGRNSVGALKLGYESKYIGTMFAQIERERPHIKGMLADRQFDADLMREMMELREGGKPGSTGNSDAQYAAKVFADYAELARTDLNRMGASIGKLDGWSGPQTHDDLKMMAAGKDRGIDGVIPRLDIQKSFPDVESLGDLKDILGDVFDQIITGVPNKATAKEKGQRVGPANLAKSLGKSRVLHFKDAENALAYRDEFGYGTAISGMISQMQRMAGMAAQMERFGPNPEVMFNAIVDSQRRQIRESALPDAEKVKQLAKLNADGGAIRHAFDVMSGLATRPVNVNAASMSSDARAIQSMAKLGGAVISSIPSDTMTAALASQFRGSGFFKGLVTQLGGILEGRSKGEKAEIAHLLGEGFDAISQKVAAAAASHDGPVGKLSRMQSTFFKWNGLQWWTDVSREAATKTVSREMGMRAATGYADLPAAYRHVLGMQGITETKWEAIRQAEFRTVDGKSYVTPDRIEDLPDEVVAPLAADSIAKERAATADRVVKRARANDQEHQWVAGRKAKLDEWLKDAEARQDSKLAGNDIRSQIEKELSSRQIALEKARIEEARTELEVLSAAREADASRDISGLLQDVRYGANADKLGEKAEAIVARLSVRDFKGGHELGARLQRAKATIRDLNAEIAKIEREANKKDAATIKSVNDQFHARQKELREFTDRVYSREQARLDQQKADIDGLPEREKRHIDGARRELAMDVRRFVADEINYSVIETDARSRRTTTMGTRPGTVAGEAMRFVMQFKGFPIAFTQRVLGRALYGQRGATKWEKIANGAPHMGALIAGLGMAGYMSMTLKDLVKGYWPPRDPEDPATWLQALQQGGGLGIYGDYLLGSANRYGSGMLETLSGPMIGTISDLANIPLKARDKALKGDSGAEVLKGVKSDVFNWTVGNVPFANLAYVKPALDYLILNSMRESIKPGSLRQKAASRRKTYGQEMVLPQRAF